MSPSALVLVRHGETEWSRSGRHTGRTDIDLTPAGRAAAHALAPLLSATTFPLVLVSPMRRSAETARLAGFEHCEVSNDLREWDYGSYEGITTPTIRETVPGWTVFTHPVPGGETIEQVAERVDRVIARVRANDRPVLVFGHGHSLRILGARWCGLPPEAARHLRLDPASVSVLGYERETPALSAWNWCPKPL